MIRRDIYLDVEEERIYTSVTRREFKPDLVTASFPEAPSFLSPTPVVAFVPKASIELMFHSKCINPLFRALLYTFNTALCPHLFHRYTLSRNSHRRFWYVTILLQLFSRHSQRDCPYFITMLYSINRDYMCSNKFITENKWYI